MKLSIWSVVAGLCLAAIAPRPAYAQQAETVPAAKIAAAFERYERIRAALANDSMKGVKEVATALVPLAKELGGTDAGDDATQLAAAATIADARTHFGDLSEALVPTFVAANIPGVHGFTCTMTNRPWAQKGAEKRNPYYGKAMPSCGVPYKATAVK